MRDDDRVLVYECEDCGFSAARLAASPAPAAGRRCPMRGRGCPGTLEPDDADPAFSRNRLHLVLPAGLPAHGGDRCRGCDRRFVVAPADCWWELNRDRTLAATLRSCAYCGDPALILCLVTTDERCRDGYRELDRLAEATAASGGREATRQLFLTHFRSSRDYGRTDVDGLNMVDEAP